VLTEHPAIAEAVTFALPHPTLGEDVGAAVVLNEQALATDGDIRDFAATRLAQFAVPRRIVIVKALPKGPTGKTSRIGLAENLGLVAPPSAGHADPRTPTEAALAAIWAEVLRLQQVGVHDDFFSLGGDSLRATMISSRVRVAFHVELSVASFFGARTVARLAVIILQQQAAGVGITFQEHATPE
jgi:acyl carrier protein